MFVLVNYTQVDQKKLAEYIWQVRLAMWRSEVLKITWPWILMFEVFLSNDVHLYEQ